jgi:peptide/nickel transport system substrate-binding protein
MKRDLRVLAAAGMLLLSSVATAAAQKQGGILKISHFDSPASMSLLEESTAAAVRPMMGVFNNLVVYDQNVPQNSMRSIVPELASSWSTNEEGTELIFSLRQVNVPGTCSPGRPVRSCASIHANLGTAMSKR